MWNRHSRKGSKRYRKPGFRRSETIRATIWLTVRTRLTMFTQLKINVIFFKIRPIVVYSSRTGCAIYPLTHSIWPWQPESVFFWGDVSFSIRFVRQRRAYKGHTHYTVCVLSSRFHCVSPEQKKKNRLPTRTPCRHCIDIFWSRRPLRPTRSVRHVFSLRQSRSPFRVRENRTPQRGKVTSTPTILKPFAVYPSSLIKTFTKPQKRRMMESYEKKHKIVCGLDGNERTLVILYRPKMTDECPTNNNWTNSYLISFC